MSADVNYFATTTLAVVFAYAAVSKMLSRSRFRSFRDSLRRYGVHTPAARTAIAVSVPILEGGCAVQLMANESSDGPAIYALSALLIVGLTAAYARASSKAPDHRLPCACFGFGESSHWVLHLAVNGTLLGLSAIGAVSVAPHNSSSPNAIAAAAIGVVAATLLISSEPIYEALKLPLGMSNTRIKP